MKVKIKLLVGLSYRTGQGDRMGRTDGQTGPDGQTVRTIRTPFIF
jgi:hypothetical protein